MCQKPDKCNRLSSGKKKEPSVELADILRTLGPDFFQGANPRQHQAIENIVKCRTAAMGGHLWGCDSCGETLPMYNSCLDRHCPKCQGVARRKWVSARMEELLDTNYFHVVFTLPHELNPLVASNPKVLINLLFQAVSRTLLAFGRDPKYLGGELGALLFLHTWTQKLKRHYHIHCIVPGGALKDDGSWISAKNPEFLFPEAALSKTFRRLFWHGTACLPNATNVFLSKQIKFEGLKSLLDNPSLVLPSVCRNLNNAAGIRNLEDRLYRKNWVVYAKRPYGGSAQVVKYLGAYTHRVAISNSRLLSYANGLVSFSYKHRTKFKVEQRRKCLPDHEFIRRFLFHILPKNLVRIRFYGFWAPRNKKTKLLLCQKLVGKAELQDSAMLASEHEEPSCEGNTPKICPFCHKKTLVLLRRIPLQERADASIHIWDSS